MTNYTLTESGLVTSDPVIASGFLGETVIGRWAVGSENEDIQECELTHVCKDDVLGDDEDIYTWILIPRPLIWQHIQPVEGEGFVRLGRVHAFDELIVEHAHDGNLAGCYHKRILLYVTTRAELREFVEWARP